MQRLLTHATLTAALAATLGGCAGTPPAAAPSPSSPSSPSLSAPQQLQAYQWDLQAAFDAQGQPSPGWQLPGRPAVRLASRRTGFRRRTCATSSVRAMR
ncbi:hypothetical protein [Xenophilus sp. Marseille-Q4582]|uniref:hypothetical protein n=1 Tax=Xenophilus sp. Marseille-Q4582 TaxID=2866600 RepID=UPI001CE405D0|nr:hypothetical protein [Xenophilus sp. Marseille-Q4582]